MSSGIPRRSVLSAVALGSTVGSIVLSTPAAQATHGSGPSASALPAEDGYDLWLRYRQVEDAGQLARYRAALGSLVWQGGGPLQ